MRPTTDGDTGGPRRTAPVTLIGAVAVLLVACGAPREPAGNASPGTPGRTTAEDAIPIPPVDGPYDWTIDLVDFVRGVDNPYFPLVPGTTLVYEGRSDGEREIVTIEVTRKTKEILGITSVVVRDTVRVDGKLKELTYDWYAQDRDGNVWYLGEDTEEYEDGKVATTAGSWEAGVDGALPGVIMPADPEIGLAFTQEHLEGEAEDKGEVVAVGETVSVPAGSFDDVVITQDWTPLEPTVRERKSYAPGIGVVFEEIVRGGGGVLRLVEVRAP